jgi:hypothetical protein
MLAVVVILFVTVIINKTWTIEFSRKISFLRVEENSGVTQNNCAMSLLKELSCEIEQIAWKAFVASRLRPDAGR